MKNTINLLLSFMCIILISSCEAIAGIFKAGMGFGIFLVVALVLGLILLVTRMNKK